jgi:hypothetical protein
MRAPYELFEVYMRLRVQYLSSKAIRLEKKKKVLNKKVVDTIKKAILITRSEKELRYVLDYVRKKESG